MRRLALLSLAAAFSTIALLPLEGCKKDEPPVSPRTTRAVRQHAEEQALETLVQDPARLRRRIDGATMVVPGTGGTSLALQDGRAQDPAAQPAWNVEVRSIAGVVQQAGSLDVFVDLAVFRPLHPPQCYLGLFHLDSIETVHTSSIEMGAGAKVVAAAPAQHQEGSYDLKVDYLAKGPHDDSSNPSERKSRLVTIVNHTFKLG